MATLQRTQCRFLAEQTLEIIKEKCYTNLNGEQIDMSSALEYSQNETIYISETEMLDRLKTEEMKSPVFEDSVRLINNLTSLDALRELVAQGEEDVAVLNFASGRNPGGGFLGGARAQEESLCRASGLYSCLIGKGEKYYEDNRRIKPNCGVYTDGMVYSPKVPVFLLENGDLMDNPVLGSFVTVPAVNASVYRKRAGGKSKENIKQEIYTIMKRRMLKFLELLRLKNHTVIVLGAWGCGAFGNATIDIANLMKECLDTKPYDQCFKKVVFAIFDGKNKSKNLPIFETVFK